MLQAELVVHSPDRPGGAPKVSEFPGAVKIHGIDNDMVMDMVLVYVRADDKGIVALRQFQGKLPADLVRLFRRDFAGPKGLAKVIGDHIVGAALSAGEIDILAFG